MNARIEGDFATRPEIEPDCFSFRELPEDGDVHAIVQELGDFWRGAVEFARLTLVNDEYPNPPYPLGVYFEGWSKAPHNYDPPHKEAPFNYPLTAQPVSAA